MVITVFGLGFVGLTTALGFAELGHEVYGVEVNADRLAGLQAGKLPFAEAGLEQALTRHLQHSFHPIDYDQLTVALRRSEVVYYCVGTPYGPDGAADLHYLLQAVDDTLQRIDKIQYRALVIKSTVPPSTTTQEIIPHIEQQGWQVGRDIGVGNNPEFLREGHCWEDFMHADRIVLGASDTRTAAVMRKIYAGVTCPVFDVTLNTAEFIKYLSNTLLATMISFSNEMANVAYAVGDIQVKRAFEILHKDRRWGNASMTSYVYPGCGYGGYCLPKDTNAFYALSHKVGCPAHMLHETIKVNEQMPETIAKRIERFVQYDKEKVIGILGLSFKPESDDVRDAPSARIMQLLQQDGFTHMVAYDPLALPADYIGSYGEILQKADVLIILTAWPEFMSLPTETQKPILDCRYKLNIDGELDLYESR